MLNIRNWAILNADWYLIYVMYTFMRSAPVWAQTDRHECKWGWEEGMRARDGAGHSEVCISDSKAAWLEFCHATIYKLKWIRSSMPWPPLKTLHCWWAMIASAIDWISISMANPVPLRGGHPKQFRHIERLIRAPELPLGPTQSIKSLRCSAATPCYSAHGESQI